MSDLFPTVGDVIAAATWLGIGALTVAAWRTRPRAHAPREHRPDPVDLPPSYRILRRPFDWHDDPTL